MLTSPPALIPAGQGVHVEDLTTPNNTQIYGVSIVIEYALSPSFATLVSPIITLAILYDAYYVTYMRNYVSIRSLFEARSHSHLVCKTTWNTMCRHYNADVM